MKFLRSSNKVKLGAALVSLALASAQPVFADNQQEELIPDDTLFYFGTGKPVAVEDFFSMLPGVLDPETLKDALPELGNIDGDGEVFKKITDFIKDPAVFTEKWGLGKELQFSAYTVGFMPVFRIAGDGEKFEAAFEEAAADTDTQFDQITHKDIKVRISPLEDEPDEKPAIKAPTAAEIATAESALSAVKEESDVIAQALDAANANLETAKKNNDASGIATAANEIADAAGKVSDISAKQVAAEKELAKLKKLTDDAEKQQMAGGKSGAGIITAAVGKDLIFAMAMNAYDPDVLDQLLGLTKPDTSLESSGKLKKIRKEWGYGDEMSMYLDFKLLADAITDGDSLAASQIREMSATDPKIQDEIGEFAKGACKTEIRQIAESMPMMVSGNRRFDVTDTTVDYDSHFAMVLEHDLLKSTLQLLRGSVPVSQSNSEAMFSMGLGLNVDTAPQLSSQITDFISGIDYQCEVLQGLNKIAETDISPLSMGAMMFSGMARGVKGISFNIYDGNLDMDAPIPVKGIDSAIAIAADDPSVLVQTLRMLPQMDILGDLPLDGTPISLNDLLPIPVPEDAEFFAAVKDKSIVIYSGEEAADFANRLSGSEEEGFILSSINTRKLLAKVSELLTQVPEEMRESNDLDKFVSFMEAYPVGNLSYKIDFTDKGIEFESTSQVERVAK